MVAGVRVDTQDKWVAKRVALFQISIDGAESLKVVLGLGEHRAEDRFDLVEFRRSRRQRRGQLDDRIPAVIGSAIQPGVVERGRKEAS